MNLPDILQKTYGPAAFTQQRRYQFAIDHFQRHFGSAGEILIFRAPGRVNLIGEHTDYNHGYVLPAALDKDFVLIARPRVDRQVNLINIESRFEPVRFEISEEIPIGEAGHWGNYAQGAAQVLAQERGASFNGFDGLVVGASPHGVPIGAGLSSSSALTVVMMVALAHFAERHGAKADLVQLSSDAEWYVGTRGGIMDQFVALLAERDHALFLDCRPASDGLYKTEAIPFPLGHQLLVVDSGIHHENSRGEFNLRVAACRAGVALIAQEMPNVTHLRDVEEIPWPDLKPLLPVETSVAALLARGEAVGAALEDIPGLTHATILPVQACCRHVWTENRRVLDAASAMHCADLSSFGELLNEAHISARDDYQISCPEVDLLVETAQQIEGVVGARLTGAGWGGCIVALVADSEVNTFTSQIQSRYRQEVGKRAAVFACQTTPGAGLIYSDFT